VVLEIDVQGGIQVSRRRPDAVAILITPPDDEELRRRLTGRGTDAPDVTARRLAKAQAEMKTARESGAYTHEVVNDDLPRAVRQVVTIIQQESQEHD
jgi:guanylate kinase